MNPKKHCLTECNRFRDLVDSDELGLRDGQLLLLVRAFSSLRLSIRESLETIPFCAFRDQLWHMEDSLSNLATDISEDSNVQIVDGDGNGLYGSEAQEYVEAKLVVVRDLIDICGEYID